MTGIAALFLAPTGLLLLLLIAWPLVSVVWQSVHYVISSIP